jgi:ATP/maltotriose-dependent transcriptional regulator MalT
MNDGQITAGALERGRVLLSQKAWTAAFAELSAADREASLGAQDLLSLALVARLLGREAENSSLLARAHQAFQAEGDVRSAVRCAFWLGFSAMLNGDMAQASGWLARARRLLDDRAEQVPEGCVEEGYLLLPVGYQSVHAGEAEIAYTAFSEAAAIGERHGDKDLIALARQGQGRALIRKGEIGRGVALLDEVMVGVTANEVSPNVAGGVYCSVIEACGEIFDIRRAQEWTTALDEWCSSHPDIVPYRGHCQIRRAEILQLRGRWAEALEAAYQACDEISKSKLSSTAQSAFYRVGEIHRLRGDFEDAEAAYRRASQLGKTQQPGLALLLLAKGQIDAAVAIVGSLLQSVRDQSPRSIMLETGVEVYLASGDLARARTCADELADLAKRINAPLLHAISSRATGEVLIAERQPALAQEELRESLRFWHEVDAPYEAARARVLLGEACCQQGDLTSAELEFDSARAVFQQLGAKTNLARLVRVNREPHHAPESPLTAREIEVLALVATGQTNRAIANALFISEKTVARHLSNIFVKLDLSSRAAATAYAYEHKLV